MPHYSKGKTFVSEQVALQLLVLIGSVIGLLTIIWRGSLLLISRLEKRADSLTDELIEAKTKALKEEVESLTTKLEQATEKVNTLTAQVTELIKRADQLRADLDAEKDAREKESKRAARAEYLEAGARKELEKKQIEVNVLREILQMLSVSVPEGALTINIIRDASQQNSTDELTDVAKKVAEGLNA